MSSAKPSAGSSTHRFQERRQERMRGAGNVQVVAKPFSFSSNAASAHSSSSTFRAPAQPSQDVAESSTARRARQSASLVRPTWGGRSSSSASGSSNSAHVIAAAATEKSRRTSDEAPTVDTPARHVASTPRPDGSSSRMADVSSSGAPLRSAMKGSRMAARASQGNAVGSSSTIRGRTSVRHAVSNEEEIDEEDYEEVQRNRLFRRTSSPSSSSVASKRVKPQPTSSTPFVERSRTASERKALQEDEEDSAPSEVDEANVEQSVSVGGGSSFNAGADEAEESDNEAGSPPLLYERVAAPTRPKPRPSASVAAAAARTSSKTQVASSPGATAAKRAMEARKRKRQASPDGQGEPSRAPAAAAAAVRPAKQSRVSLAASSYAPEVSMRAPAAEPSQAERSAMQKRLRSVVRLALGGTGLSEKGVTDVDLLWNVVERELKAAADAEPRAAPQRALKQIRRSSRKLFERLSLQASERATLLRQLSAARKRKRQLRDAVFEQRELLLRAKAEEEALKKQHRDVTESEARVLQLNNYLEDLRSAAAAWM